MCTYHIAARLGLFKKEIQYFFLYPLLTPVEETRVWQTDNGSFSFYTR